ncbi:hypothetical protein [Nitrosospira sp. Nsp11]|uniref:hypothetical protein n=1 Tax=Nitrosospira sp. Nsp11 TaxID=1855338 RepID=UPI00093461BB|nr:hypothetical protein [Nitrosospira sp. Nsp11]
MNTLCFLLEAALQTSASMAARLSGTHRQWRGILARNYAGIFNLDVSGIWHNFHPHSVRWALPLPPGGASDVHGMSSLETFITDTEIPPAIRLPYALEQFQWNPSENACRVRIRGDFLFHCHVEEHMMAGLAGLVRARQYIWISDELSKSIEVELPFDDGMNECPSVDILRCLHDHDAAPTSGHDHSGGAREHLAPTVEAVGMAGMGMGGMSAMPSRDILEAATKGRWELLPCPAPILAIHGAVSHTGKVLLFAGSGNDELFTTGLRSAVWDYENGEFISPFTPVDFFCAGQAFLPDGRLLVAGGTKEYDRDGCPFVGLETSYLFDPLSESGRSVARVPEYSHKHNDHCHVAGRIQPEQRSLRQRAAGACPRPAGHDPGRRRPRDQHRAYYRSESFRAGL